MTNFTTENFDVRPVVANRCSWEAQRLADGSSRFFQTLTDALMYAESVTYWDALSDDAREFWDMVENR